MAPRCPDAIYGAASASSYPASTGLVPQTVEEGQLQPANALLGLSAGLTAVVGPAVAGMIVSLVGPRPRSGSMR